MGKTRMIFGLAIDVAAGVVLAGVLAPVTLAVLPEGLHGRALLFGVCAGCVAAVHLFRAHVPGRQH